MYSELVRQNAWKREVRALAWLFPLVLCTAGSILLVFHVYGGHRQAYIDDNPFCGTELRTPIAMRSGWGGAHGQPLVLVQVTDLHVNDIDGGQAKTMFRMFLETVLPPMAPYIDAVVVTGDLVSSKRFAAHMHRLVGHYSQQILSEWKWYNSTVSETIKQLKIRKWITVPGNHDVFGSSSRQFYREYGMHPPLPLNKTYSRSHVTTIRGHMLFGLDAALNPSPHRPMNFFGMVTPEMEDDLLNNLREHRARGTGGASVVFGHYPSALMASGKAIGRTFARVDAEFPLQPSSNLYLSGHLHDLKGYARHGLQASSKLGHLELQLPDMFTTGSYRILIVDHGLPTWKDFRLSEHLERLIIVVTNPTGSAVSVAGACYAALKSTHVRFLVFPNGQRLPEGFLVAIDGISVGIARRLAHENKKSIGFVYAVPWNSREYYGDKRSHVLEVRDQSSDEVLSRHIFTLRGQLVKTEQWAKWTAFVGAFFSLSEFEKIARTCVWLGLCSATCIGLVTLFILQRLCHGPAGILICSCAMMIGPLVISQDLTEQGGWGWISLRMVNVEEGALSGGVDPYFSMFLIVFTSIVPSAYLCLVTALCPDLPLSILIRCASALSCAQCVRWVLTIAGAHGIRASIISPSCAPLLITLITCHASQLRLPIKRKRG